MDTTIDVTALTDHATVELCISISVEKIKSNRWRLNISLLQNAVFKQTISEDLTNFFYIKRSHIMKNTFPLVSTYINWSSLSLPTPRMRKANELWSLQPTHW